MEQRQLGRSGLKVPVLALGTATFGGEGEWFSRWGNVDAASARRMVDICLERGVSLFDTANNYSGGKAEVLLGQALAGRRQDALVSTKVNTRVGTGPNDVGSSRAHIVRACEDSLRRLGTDWIDIYQLHGFDGLTPVEETLRALDDLVRSGKVRYIGCSNFSGWQLMKSLAVSERMGLERHIVHQVHYSLASRELEWELMPLAVAEGIGLSVWGALSGAQLSGKLRRGAPEPKEGRIASGAIFPVPRDRLFRITDALEAVVAQTGRSMAQVALRWVMQRPGISNIVVGARDSAQLNENLVACEFVLEPSHMDMLNAASATPQPYPYWHQLAVDSERNSPLF